MEAGVLCPALWEPGVMFIPIWKRGVLFPAIWKARVMFPAREQREQNSEPDAEYIVVNNKLTMQFFPHHRGFLGVHCGIMFSVSIEGQHWCLPLQCSAVQCRPCSAVQCSAVQCSAVQCSAVQCSAVQCNAVQCHKEQFAQVEEWREQSMLGQAGRKEVVREMVGRVGLGLCRGLVQQVNCIKLSPAHWTVHCKTVYTVHCTLYTVHCTLYTVHLTELYTFSRWLAWVFLQSAGRSLSSGGRCLERKREDWKPSVWVNLTNYQAVLLSVLTLDVNKWLKTVLKDKVFMSIVLHNHTGYFDH